MEPILNLNNQDALALLAILQKGFQQPQPATDPNAPKISGMAAYLLQKAGYEVTDKTGQIIEKSLVDEVTLDFTRGRTLSEEQAELAIRFIFDTNPYLNLFNTRIVKKIVTPVKGTAITQKNLISNEQLGGQVEVINRRIVHNFGVNMFLRHCQLQKDIPLQTVIDNLHNPGWEQSVINDVAVSLGNDILLLAINGLGGNYASTQNFYDLNLGFNKMLQVADGVHTNTYGDIKVSGFLGRYLTPHKVDASGAIGSDYTGANLIAVLRKMYNAMPSRHRNDPGNVFLMSQTDIDLYVNSRSDISNPSNPVKEDILTTGRVPNFMGYRLVAMPGWIGINETHEEDSSLYGSILFGNPKNLDVASDSTTYRKNLMFNARASLGPSFEYTYDMYLDFQGARLDGFVIAFNGAKVSAPILLSDADSKNGINAFTQSGTNTYTQSGSATTKFHVVCHNEGAVVVRSTANLSGTSYDTLEEALGAENAAVVPDNGYFTVASSDHIYLRAYHPNMVASDCIDCNITIS